MNANSGSGNPTLLDSTERLSEIAANWRVVQYGQNDVFGLECINTYFGETTLSVRLSREGGLGLDLVEVSNKDPKHGLVVINEIIPDSNAAKSKILQLGDALISISGATPSGNLICNLQGLSLDATFNELGRFSEASEVVIVARRLIKRKNVVVRVYGSEGEYFTNFTVLSGYGANLRTALISNNIRLYDSRTERVDSPYQQGDCGGDGSCGTCMVAILAG